ncbi:MAG: hypothetical protein PHX89_02575 [bacterium]|jgi:beta-galactosidase/beta-glucuronidase|nr:hypothetical protein [bacterium]
MKLGGEWRFRLDPDEEGLKERWFEHGESISEPIQVPGCSCRAKWDAACLYRSAAYCG